MKSQTGTSRYLCCWYIEVVRIWNLGGESPHYCTYLSNFKLTTGTSETWLSPASSASPIAMLNILTNTLPALAVVGTSPRARGGAGGGPGGGAGGGGGGAPRS